MHAAAKTDEFLEEFQENMFLEKHTIHYSRTCAIHTNTRKTIKRVAGSNTINSVQVLNTKFTQKNCVQQTKTTHTL